MHLWVPVALCSLQSADMDVFSNGVIGGSLDRLPHHPPTPEGVGWHLAPATHSTFLHLVEEGMDHGPSIIVLGAGAMKIRLNGRHQAPFDP